MLCYYITIVLISIFYYFSSNNNYVLNVCPYNDDYLEKYYKNYKNKHIGDSGIDIVTPYQILLKPKTYTKVEYYTSFRLTKNNIPKSYYLYPRSFLSKYPLVYLNGVGIIDAGFNGNLSSIIYNPNDYNITFRKGTKFVQICAEDLSEIIVKVNCDVKQYGTRGSNGFGSTNYKN